MFLSPPVERGARPGQDLPTSRSLSAKSEFQVPAFEEFVYNSENADVQARVRTIVVHTLSCQWLPPCLALHLWCRVGKEVPIFLRIVAVHDSDPRLSFSLAAA